MKFIPKQKKVYFFLILISIILISSISTQEIIPKESIKDIDNIISSGNIKWNIEKTGDEENLDVSYEIINSTTTEFCIRAKNPIEYKEILDEKSKSSMEVPIQNLNELQLSISKNYLNLSKDEDCFKINYKELKLGMEFKIGWNTVTISTQTTDSLSYSIQSMICRSPNGMLHTAFIDSGDDLWYANSTDDGITWSSKEVIVGTISGHGIICNSTNGVMIYHINTGDLDAIISPDSGISWGGAITIEDDIGTLTYSSCVYDSNDIFHCVTIEGADSAYYVNSTTLNSVVAVNTNTLDDSDWCNIEVNGSNCIYIACTGSDQNDIDFWRSCGNGWGDANRQELYAGTDTSTITTGDGINFGFDNAGLLNAVFISNNFPQYCYATSTLSSITCQAPTISGTASCYNPDIGISSNGRIDIICSDSTTTGSYLEKTYSYDKTTWTSSQLATTSGWIHIADTTYADSNKQDLMQRFIFLDAGSNIIYSNYSTAIPEILTINYPTNNQEILNSLSTTLNTSQYGYNQTIWYTWNNGIKNYTLCTNSNECQATITFPRQGYYNLIVYANKNDGTITSKNVTNLFVGNYTYQENANWNTTNMPTNPVNVFDGNYSSYATTNTNSYSYMNYSFNNLLGTLLNASLTWQIKPTNNLLNVQNNSISISCINNGNLSFRVYSQSGGLGTWTCLNYSSGAYITLDTCTGAGACERIYEEGVNWFYYSQNLVPTITNLLSNNSNFSTSNINFTFNISDDNDYLNNISLYLDGILNSTIYNIPINVSINNSLSINVTGINDGYHSWFIRAFDSDGLISNSTNDTFTITGGGGQTLNVDISDAFNLNDIQDRNSLNSRSLFDKLTNSLIISRLSNLFKSILQTISINSFVDRFSASLKSVSQLLTIETFTDRIESGIRSINQIVNIKTYTNRLISAFKTPFQVLTIINFVDRDLFSFKDIYQTISSSISTSKLFNSVKSITQTTSISNYANRFLSAVRNIYQNLNIKNFVDRIALFIRSIFVKVNISTHTSTNKTDLSPPRCSLVSRTPSDILDNSTGVLSVIINCTDISGINVTKSGEHYAFFITRTVDAFIIAPGIPNYWSNRYPNNSLGVIGGLTPSYKIWRALGRNEGYWYDNITTLNKSCEGINPCYNILNDTYSYAIEDGEYGHFNITNTSTDLIINYTHPRVDIAAFRQSVYLSYEAMVKEGKKNYTIDKDNYLLMKRFDAEAYRNTANYTMNSFRNFAVTGVPQKTLRAFYCNSSYNPSGSTQVIDSPNCALISSLTSTELNNIVDTDRNSSYSKGTYGITNGLFGGIKATAEFYIEYESPESATGKSYELRYANGTTNTDIAFNDSKVAWITTNGGTTWVQANFTPDVMTTSVRSANDEFQFGIYVCDLLGNCYSNFTFFKNDITLTNHPISFPLVLEYNSSAFSMDIELNETHRRIMNIRIGVSKDPDSVGNVTHNLTLRNLDGSFNYTINGSFKSLDDSDVWINFNTSLVQDGKYRMNITAYSGDNTLDIKSRTTDRNFTINQTITYSNNVSQSSSLISSSSRTSFSFRNLFQNLTIKDFTNRILSAFRNTYQIIRIDIFVNRIELAIRSIYQTFSIPNFLERTLYSFRNLKETISIDNTVNRILYSFKSIYNLISIDNFTDKVGKLFININDNFSIKDFTDRVGKLFININDNLSISDFTERMLSSIRNLIDKVRIILHLEIISPDRRPPIWNNNRNFTHLINTPFNESFTANDDIAIDNYQLNDTTYFNIDRYGFITNKTNLSRLEIHWLNVSVNDTSNKMNSTIIYILITDVISKQETAICRYSKFNYYNLDLTWFKQNNCVLSKKQEKLAYRK